MSRILGHAPFDTYTHLFAHAAHAADIRDRMGASAFALLIAERVANHPALRSP